MPCVHLDRPAGPNYSPRLVPSGLPIRASSPPFNAPPNRSPHVSRTLRRRKDSVVCARKAVAVMLFRWTAAVLAAATVAGCQSPGWTARTRDRFRPRAESAVAARSPSEEAPVDAAVETNVPGASRAADAWPELRTVSRNDESRIPDQGDNRLSAASARSGRRPSLESLLHRQARSEEGLAENDRTSRATTGGGHARSGPSSTDASGMSIVPRHVAGLATRSSAVPTAASAMAAPAPSAGPWPEVRPSPAPGPARQPSSNDHRDNSHLTAIPVAMSSGSLLHSEMASPGANAAIQLEEAADLRSARAVGAAEVSAEIAPDNPSRDAISGNAAAVGGTGRRWPPAAWPPIDEERRSSAAGEQTTLTNSKAPASADRPGDSAASWPEVQPWPYRPGTRNEPAPMHTFDVAPSARRFDGAFGESTARAASTPGSIPGPLTMPGPSPISGQGPVASRSTAPAPFVPTGWSSGNTPASLDGDRPSASQAPPRWPGISTGGP